MKRNTTRKHSSYYHHKQHTLWTLRDGMWQQQKLLRKHWTFWTFKEMITGTQQHVPAQAVPIDVIAVANNQVRTGPASQYPLGNSPMTTNITPWHQQPY
jgi:hypothetical protein